MLAALAAGVLVSFYIPALPLVPVLMGCGISGVLLLLIGGLFARAREITWGAAVLMLCLGFGLWHTHYALQKSQWVDETEPQPHRVQVLQAPVERQRSWQVPVRLTGGQEAILFVQKDSTLRLPVAGDILMVRTAITRPSPADPYCFDYGHYLRLQGMVGTGYVARGGMLLIGHERLRGIMPAMRRVRERIERRLEPFPLRERGVLESLLLGDRRRLSADTREAFAASGAMHVLAVSGLHVGIIAALLMSVLTLGGRRKPLLEEKRRRTLQALILSSALIFYALLTGLAPSVCRSVLMFVLMIVGRLIRPQTSTYHNLAVAAFLILCIQPLALVQPGFLLSFSAVLGIVRLQPALELRRAPKAVRAVWDLVAVSLCAQLATLPWTIGFFHRVSNYFVLTNLVVLPLVEFLLIPAFLLFLVFAPIPYVGAALGTILERITRFMNDYVAWVQALPGASSELYLNASLTAVLVAILFMFMLRTPWRFAASAVLTIVFVALLAADYRAAQTESDRVVYTRGRQQAIMAREGRSALILTNDSAYALQASHDYLLARHIHQLQIIPTPQP